GLVFPPDATGAVPVRGPAATEGLRTVPPRENGGNFDVKQLTKGSKLLLPVAVEGGLFSTGDGHFAQGDGEVCVTAVEMGATASVRFKVIKGTAANRALRGPRFSHAGYFAPPEWASPRGLSESRPPASLHVRVVVCPTTLSRTSPGNRVSSRPAATARWNRMPRPSSECRSRPCAISPRCRGWPAPWWICIPSSGCRCI